MDDSGTSGVESLEVIELTVVSVLGERVWLSASTTLNGGVYGSVETLELGV